MSILEKRFVWRRDERDRRHAPYILSQLQRDNVATEQTRDTLGGDVVALQRGLLAILLRLAARYDEGLPLAEQALAYMDAKQPAPHWRGEKARLTLEIGRASCRERVYACV